MGETVTCDVVVIGAGIAGSSAAFHLAAQGIKTVLVEREHPASGPTGKSSAVCHYFYTVPQLSRLARRGCQILKEIPRSCGGPVVFHGNGVLWAAGENNADEFARTVARIRDEEGGGIEALAPSDIARMAPGFRAGAGGEWVHAHPCAQRISSPPPSLRLDASMASRSPSTSRANAACSPT